MSGSKSESKPKCAANSSTRLLRKPLHKFAVYTLIDCIALVFDAFGERHHPFGGASVAGSTECRWIADRANSHHRLLRLLRIRGVLITIPTADLVAVLAVTKMKLKMSEGQKRMNVVT